MHHYLREVFLEGPGETLASLLDRLVLGLLDHVQEGQVQRVQALTAARHVAHQRWVLILALDDTPVADLLQIGKGLLGETSLAQDEIVEVAPGGFPRSHGRLLIIRVLFW